MKDPTTPVADPERIVIPDEPHTDGDRVAAPVDVPAMRPTGASPDEVEVQCPGCGLTVLGDSPRPTAAWFCPRCDYPLFWASGGPEPARPPSRAARRRLPGTSGRQVLGAEPCWHCGEMNDLDIKECGRCAATLPKPNAPKVYVPEPVPVPFPVAVRTTVWPFVAAGTLGGASIAMALTLWLTGA